MARITAKMRVRDLLEHHPDAEDTVAWYGIALSASDMGRTLEALCYDDDLPPRRNRSVK